MPMIGRDGKVVIVKQGGSLREVTRMHITRLRGMKKAEVVDEAKEELVTVWERVVVRRGNGRILERGGDSQDEGWREIQDGA